jgi:hypothetical protein
MGVATAVGGTGITEQDNRRAGIRRGMGVATARVPMPSIEEARA